VPWSAEHVEEKFEQRSDSWQPDIAVGEKKTFYRADHRELEPGDVILPGEKDYIEGLAGHHRAVEDLLRTTLPDGANTRGKTVHVFEDQEVATNYWLPWAMKGRHLYEVEADSDDIIRSGDMRLYNEAAAKKVDDAERQQLVDDYCSGKRSSRPMIEVMAKKVRVKKRLHAAAEGRVLFRKKHFPHNQGS
jgi:hypothetical protein